MTENNKLSDCPGSSISHQISLNFSFILNYFYLIHPFFSLKVVRYITKIILGDNFTHKLLISTPFDPTFIVIFSIKLIKIISSFRFVLKSPKSGFERSNNLEQLKE